MIRFAYFVFVLYCLCLFMAIIYGLLIVFGIEGFFTAAGGFFILGIAWVLSEDMVKK